MFSKRSLKKEISSLCDEYLNEMSDIKHLKCALVVLNKHKKNNMARSLRIVIIDMMGECIKKGTKIRRLEKSIKKKR